MAIEIKKKKIKKIMLKTFFLFIGFVLSSELSFTVNKIVSVVLEIRNNINDKISPEEYIQRNEARIIKEFENFPLLRSALDFTRPFDLLRTVVFYDQLYKFEFFNFSVILMERPSTLIYARELLRSAKEIRRILLSLIGNSYDILLLISFDRLLQVQAYIITLLMRPNLSPAHPLVSDCLQVYLNKLESIICEKFNNFFKDVLLEFLKEKFLFCVLVEATIDYPIQFDQVRSRIYSIPLTHQQLLAESRLIFKVIIDRFTALRRSKPSDGNSWLRLQQDLRECCRLLVELEGEFIKKAYTLDGNLKAFGEFEIMTINSWIQFRVFLVPSNSSLPFLASIYTISTKPNSFTKLIYISDNYRRKVKFIEALKKYLVRGINYSEPEIISLLDTEILWLIKNIG